MRPGPENTSIFSEDPGEDCTLENLPSGKASKSLNGDEDPAPPMVLKDGELSKRRYDRPEPSSELDAARLVGVVGADEVKDLETTSFNAGSPGQDLTFIVRR